MSFDSGDKLHQQTKLHTIKGLFEINNLYKIKMDTVNSNDYMKINWAENGTTEYLVFKETKIYWQLDKETIKKCNLIITLTLIILLNLMAP